MRQVKIVHIYMKIELDAQSSSSSVISICNHVLLCESKNLIHHLKNAVVGTNPVYEIFSVRKDIPTMGNHISFWRDIIFRAVSIPTLRLNLAISTS